MYKKNNLKQLQIIQKLRDEFWIRRYREYLGELQQRSKWQSNCGNLIVGQIVLVGWLETTIYQPSSRHVMLVSFLGKSGSDKNLWRNNFQCCGPDVPITYRKLKLLWRAACRVTCWENTTSTRPIATRTKLAIKRSIRIYDHIYSFLYVTNKFYFKFHTGQLKQSITRNTIH